MSTVRREKVILLRDSCGNIVCSCGCGRPPGPGRRTWHSQECVDSWLLVNSPSYIRRLVWARDRGTCAECGCNAPKEFKLAKIRLKSLWEQARASGMSYGAAKKHVAKNSGGWTLGRSTGWDCDHVVAVVDGGGQCTLDNYQTLCTPCHKAKTKQLHQRIFGKSLNKPDEAN